MSYNPERACQYCKSLAHIDKYCPGFKTCIYCKGDHNIIKCTKITCRRCKIKGHHQVICPNTSEYIGLDPVLGGSKQHGIFTTKRPSSASELISFKRQRTLDPYTSVNLNISVQSPEHSDKKWVAIDESVRDELSLQEKFIFPYLKPLCSGMISEIMQGLLPGSSSPHCNYPEIIDEHGGVEKVTESLIHLYPVPGP
ncbi:hypothetical protein ABZX51_009464 [Aspergillus tubingensis]